MALLGQNLGRRVVGVAEHGERALAHRELLRRAEVRQLEVAVRVDEKRVWAEVAVDDTLRVEERQDEDNLGEVELRRQRGGGWPSGVSIRG